MLVRRLAWRHNAFGVNIRRVDQSVTKHILSIDGGGIRGILPLALLTEIESRRRPCADLFDMVAGTSIGGIIATGWSRAYKRGPPGKM